MKVCVMRYEGRIYRPPSEANSLILQFTVGCSHNRCAFCAMYSDKRYRVRPFEEIREDIAEAARYYPETRRVFIGDGDALSARVDAFEQVCACINEAFPRLERIAAYVNARDILQCTAEDLARLRRLRFSLAYLGLESGSEEVLTLIRKGATPADMIAMAAACRRADIALSTIVLLGAGGAELSGAHIEGTIATVNAMQPKFLSFLTAMIVPHTSLMAWVEQGRFRPLTDRAILVEARQMLDGLVMEDALFRMNHVSNLIALGGRLPQDKEKLLRQLDQLLPLAQNTVTCICSEAEGLLL